MAIIKNPTIVIGGGGAPSGMYALEFVSDSDTFGYVYITQGESIKNNPFDMAKIGYAFIGWSTTQGGSTISYPYTPSEDLTLYAVWLSVTPKASLSDYTWGEIKQLADLVANQILSASDLSNTYNIAIGDTKSSTINGETHSYRLIGLRHDVDASDNYLGMTFEQVDLMANAMKLVNYGSSSASWDNSNLKTTINAFTIASDLDAVITAAKKPCAYSVSSGTPLTYVTTKLWIESQTEVFNRQGDTIGGTVEGSQYQYYANGGSKIKQLSGSNNFWWLRSPNGWNSNYYYSFFCGVASNGSESTSNGSNSQGVAPCFCI